MCEGIPGFILNSVTQLSPILQVKFHLLVLGGTIEPVKTTV